jgi:hypothetical protein
MHSLFRLCICDTCQPPEHMDFDLRAGGQGLSHALLEWACSACARVVWRACGFRATGAEAGPRPAAQRPAAGLPDESAVTQGRARALSSA